MALHETSSLACLNYIELWKKTRKECANDGYLDLDNNRHVATHLQFRKCKP